MDIVFYANCNPLADLIRLDTRQPGEAWQRTPSHCAVRFGEWIFESTLRNGIALRRVNPAIDGWAYELPLPDETTACNMAYTLVMRHTKYGWEAVAATYLGNMLVPAGMRLVDDQNCPDCSLFAAHIISFGGLALPEWKAPPSPNDLLIYAESVTRSAKGTPCEN